MVERGGPAEDCGHGREVARTRAGKAHKTGQDFRNIDRGKDAEQEREDGKVCMFFWGETKYAVELSPHVEKAHARREFKRVHLRRAAAAHSTAAKNNTQDNID
jgi:hypothetical protein